MKRIKNAAKYSLYILLSVVFLSCKSEGEKEYTKDYWKYKTKTLELEYLEKLNRVSTSAELERTIMWADSIKANY